MRVAVLGTGVVGRTLAGGLAARGHDVVVGTRDPSVTAERHLEGDAGPTWADWLEGASEVGLATFAQAAADADLVLNAASGDASIAVLLSAGEDNLTRKVLLDVANPLDFSRGFPPFLSVCNDDSLAERIQRTFPGAKVVKSLNTVNYALMVNPPAGATMFVSGDDEAAKATVGGLLRDLGWTSIADLGDLSGARGQEMYLALWVRVMSALGTAGFSMSLTMPDGSTVGVGNSQERP